LTAELQPAGRWLAQIVPAGSDGKTALWLDALASGSERVEPGWLANCVRYFFILSAAPSKVVTIACIIPSLVM
jgi:hypothetical protein